MKISSLDGGLAAYYDTKVIKSKPVFLICGMLKDFVQENADVKIHAEKRLAELEAMERNGRTCYVSRIHKEALEGALSDDNRK